MKYHLMFTLKKVVDTVLIGPGNEPGHGLLSTQICLTMVSNQSGAVFFQP